MKKNRGRFSYLFVGVLIGLLIAWSIIWWQGSTGGHWGFFRDVKHYIGKLFSSSKDKDDETIITEDNTTKKNTVADPLRNTKLKSDSAYYDSTNFDFSNPDALDEFLAMYNGQLPDSLLFDSILKSQNNTSAGEISSGDMHVKKDKLVFARSFTVPGISYYMSDNTEKLDSLLSEDNPTVKDKNSGVLHVEFWKSPINYKGYKTGKNKLVLFGIDRAGMISFKMMNNILYMKYLSDYYQIDRTLDFKSLIPINNTSLVSQLNSQ